MFLQILGLSLVILVGSFLMLGFRVLFKKGGRFPNGSVNGNVAFRRMGITCTKCEEQAKYARLKKLRNQFDIEPGELQVLQS